MFEAVSLTLLGVGFIFLIVFVVYITFAERKDISVWRKLPMLLVVVFIELAIFVITAIQVLNHE